MAVRPRGHRSVKGHEQAEVRKYDMINEMRLIQISRICILRYDTTYLGSKYIYNSSFLIHYHLHKSQATESRTRHNIRCSTCTKRHSPLIINTDTIWKEEVLTLGTFDLVFQFELIDISSSAVGRNRGRVVIGVNEISAFTSDHIGVLRISLTGINVEQLT
jgi:hypothetical protein